MRKTYVVILPDRAGELLSVMRALEESGVDVKRVSHNAVVDPHTYFVDAEGTGAALADADASLDEMGVLDSSAEVGEVALLELTVGDSVGALVPALELIYSYGFNITFCDARVMSPGDQKVLVGVYVEQAEDLDPFLAEARRICPTRVVPYDKSRHVIDNSYFYLSFARGMGGRLGLSAEQEHTVLVNSNRIVQSLEGTGANPFKPFEYLDDFASGIEEYRGDAFARATRVTRLETPGGVRCTCVEPPAGSNTWILEAEGRLLCVDSGYRAFRREYQGLYRSLFPDWDGCRKELLLTHADIDHAGCTDLFDAVYAVRDVLDNFGMEAAGEPNWRAGNPLHRAYEEIAKVLTSYEPPVVDGRFSCIGHRDRFSDDPIARCYTAAGEEAWLEVPPFRFEVWQGAGGHVPGETVLVDRAQRVCVSGDIFVNVHDETKQQRRFDSLAPYLMVSVDMDPELSRRERKALFGMLDAGEWLVLGGHGAPYRHVAG